MYRADSIPPITGNSNCSQKDSWLESSVFTEREVLVVDFKWQQAKLTQSPRKAW